MSDYTEMFVKRERQWTTDDINDYKKIIDGLKKLRRPGLKECILEQEQHLNDLIHKRIKLETEGIYV